MRRSNKHQPQRIIFGNLVGGVNTAEAPERIPDTDMVACKNFIYDGMRLKSKGGISPVSFSLSGDIQSIYYDVDDNVIVTVEPQ